MKLTVNGQERVLEEVDPTMPLLWAIRDLLGLKGTKFGCGQALCGACTVRVDGLVVRGCLMLAAQCDGAEVPTIEQAADLATGGSIDYHLPRAGEALQPGSAVWRLANRRLLAGVTRAN